MKTKNKIVFKLTIILVLVFANSCYWESPSSYWFIFYPRECNYVYIEPARVITKIVDGHTYYEYRDMESDESISMKDFSLQFLTLKHNLDSLRYGSMDYYMNTLVDINEHDSALEEQIKTSYNQANKRTGSFRSAGNSDICAEPPPVTIEYRLNGIKKINTKAIDAQLFDETVGSSLNKYLKILQYEPDFIASSISRNLLYGFTDAGKPESIEEWLSLQPLANESMYFAFNMESDKLPLSTRFVVEMETEDGRLLSDTTNVITLTK